MSRPPCFNCSAPSHHDHHVVPRSMGGVATVPLCGACHGLAHGHSGLRHVRDLTKAALAAKAARGEALGEVPFGYRRVGIMRVEDAGEAVVVRTVRALRAEGVSLRAIVAKLEELGHKSRAGKPLAITQVARIVRRLEAEDGLPLPHGRRGRPRKEAA